MVSCEMRTAPCSLEMDVLCHLPLSMVTFCKYNRYLILCDCSDDYKNVRLYLM